MASITETDAMQMVAFRIQRDLYNDTKERARKLGYTNLSEYLRSLVSLDVRGIRMLEKGTLSDLVNPVPAEDDKTDPEPPMDQSDPQEAPEQKE